LRKLCTLLVAALIACLGLATVAKAATQTIEAETFTLNPSSAGMVQNNASASGGKELWVWSNATASKSVTHDEVAKVTVRARAQLCGTAAPRVEIRVDGNAVGSVNVSSTPFADYAVNVNIPAGTHQLGLAYTNDVRTSSCDRNVLVDKVTLEGASSDTTAPDTSISSGPAEGSTDTDGNVSFGFSGTDNVGVTGFECSNVAQGQADNFTSCTSPKAYSGLANGSYTFKVRARDAANNTDQSPATRNYAVNVSSGASAISLGVYNGSMYNQGATGGFDTEAQLLGRSPKVFMWYPNAAQHWPFETAKANYAKNQHGADIHLTWEWFNTSYSSITAGQHDAYIRQYARDAAAYGDPILMRMFHEMNGNWYSWSLSSDSVADNHKAAWQHIVTIFRQEGATNVKFFWCPNDGGDYDARLQRAWPGDEYVDVVGVDSYNGPPSWADPRSAEGMFRAKYNFFYNTLGSQRPFAIGETNSREATSYPGGKDQWVTDVMNQLTDGSWPKLIHVTIFDDNYGGYNDWRINSFQTALDAYKAWYADPRYQGTLP